MEKIMNYNFGEFSFGEHVPQEAVYEAFANGKNNSMHCSLACFFSICLPLLVYSFLCSWVSVTRYETVRDI